MHVCTNMYNIYICVEVDLDELCVYTHASVLIAIKSELRPCYAVPSDGWFGVSQTSSMSQSSRTLSPA